MRLGDFFVEIGITPNKKNVQAVEETINRLKDLREEIKKEIDLEKELAKAENDEQKAKIKKKYALDNEIKGLEKANKQQKMQIANFKGMVRGALGVVTAISGVAFALDRMVNSLGRANQKLMNFQHQTGISLSTLNRYASANALANPLTSIEGTAGSLQNVAQNLWDIQLGRGDASAFQELSYFSGTNVTPYGKSLEEVIESVRSALRNIPNDIQATNLIQRMGFSPDDLQMLRMTKQEFEEVQNLFLNPQQRKELEGYTRELNKIHLEIKLIYDKVVLQLAKPVLKIAKMLTPLLKLIGRGLEDILFIANGILIPFEKLYDFLSKMPVLTSGLKFGFLALLTAINPLLGALSMLFLMIDDIIGYFQGKRSAFGMLLYYLDMLGQQLTEKFNTAPLIKNIKEVGEAVNKYFAGGGFKNLANLVTMFTGIALNGINTVPQMIMDNIRNNQAGQVINTNNADNKKISFNINTNSLNGMNDFYTSVTGQNLIGEMC